MTVSILIAKILGPLYMVSAFAWLFNRNSYGRMVEEYANNRGLLYLSAIMAFLFGAVVLTFHNIWVADWRIIITLLAFLGLIKGLSLIVFPEQSIKLTFAMIRNERLLAFLFAIAFVLGVILSWFGYVA